MKIKKRSLFSLISSIILLFNSCQFFENDVADFMEKYTETAAIEEHKFKVETYKDSQEHLNISSFEDAGLDLFMRNPKKFNMTPSIVFNNLDSSISRDSVAIRQVDSNSLFISMPQEFLIPADEGKNITAEISLYEPMSGRTFEKYKIDLYCNSKPPVILNPTVINNAGSSFVIAFDMPNEEEVAIRHKDIAEIIIEGVSYPVEISTEADSEGILHANYNFPDSHFSRHWNDSYIIINQKDFTENRNSVYFETGIPFEAMDKEFSLEVKDNAGLSSSVKASTSISKLLKPVIMDQGGSVISETGTAGIPYNEETQVGTITIIPPEQDHLGNSVSGSTVYYRIYEATGSGKIYTSGTTTEEKTIELPQNTYRTEAYAVLTNYENSSTTNVRFRFVNNIIYVKSNFENGDGSEAAPYATIAAAIEDINARPNKDTKYTLYLEGDIDEDVTIAGPLNTDELVIQKNPKAAAAPSIKSITVDSSLPSDFRLSLKSFNISGSAGAGLTQNSLITLPVENVTVSSNAGCGIVISRGAVTLKNSTVSANANGGINVDSSANLNVSGATVVQNNTIPGTPSAVTANVILPVGKKIAVTGPLTSGCMIGVTTAASDLPALIGGKYSFTTAYGSNNSVSPSSYFISDKAGYSIIPNGGEAAIALAGANGSLSYNASEYRINFTSTEMDGTTPVTGIYFGTSKPILLTPVVTVAGNSLTPVITAGELYISDIKANLNISLYNGVTKVQNIPSANLTDGGSGRLKLLLPDIPYKGNYTIKIITTYLGLTHESNINLAVDYSAENAAQYISSLNTAGTYDVVVEGPVGSGYEAGSEEGLKKVANAIKSLTMGSDRGVRINLDTTGTINSSNIESYNGGQYFNSLGALLSIQLPDWMQYLIGSLFLSCENMTSITIPDTVQLVMTSAFSGCGSLTDITLPAAICGSGNDHGIMADAFENCDHLETINFTGTTTQWKQTKRAAGWHSGVPATVVHCVDGDCGLDDIPLLTVNVTETTFDGSSEVTDSAVFISGRNIGTINNLIASDHEVTQGEYKKYMGFNPNETYGVGQNYPAYNMNWYEAIIYCNLRSIAEGLTPAYYLADSLGNELYGEGNGRNPDNWRQYGTHIYKNMYGQIYYDDSTENNSLLDYTGSGDTDGGIRYDETANGWRLPTEVEWEFLARGGNLTGTQTEYSGSNTIGNVAWHTYNSGDNGTDSNRKLHEVKGLASNGLGLYDMSGNVWEMCWDWYSDSIDDNTDTDGPASGTTRVMRGGAFTSITSYCSVYKRHYFNPAGRNYTQGFRVVRNAN